MAVREGLAGSLSITEDDLRRLIESAMPGIRPATSESLAATVRLRKVARHDTIFQQGEVVPLALIVRGYGAFRRTTVDGRPLTVNIANPGQLYGLTGIASVISSVDMVALTDCDTGTWVGTEVRDLVAADPQFALDVIDRMASFLNVLTENLDGFLHQDARRRVVRVLVRHRDLFFAEPAVLSRSQLPSLVGTSREMTGRVLRELEREGVLLRVGLTGLRLLRPDQLDADAAGSARDGH